MAYPMFPIFHDHDAAAAWGCFQCGTPADPANAEDKGYPPGRGKYGIKCAHCGATFFYDLVKEHPAANALQLAILTQQERR